MDFELKEEDMAVDEGIGYPKAYAKFCRDRSAAGLFTHGPPFTFIPSSMQQHEVARAKQLEQMFPIIDPKAKPTAKPKIFASLLWKQLNHLGNAGFDPAVIRVDSYGNVLYLHADKASPLAWDIDHWFPCQRGGLTVPSNLRILQWQVCKRKHNKLEFLIPWWDFQLGISVNQFISIFASSNSDFRHRAFSFLFMEGENEELNDSQTVESHSFPQHFFESKEQVGLASAALVVSRREFHDSSLTLRSLDYNRQRSQSPAITARKVKHFGSKENENPDFAGNPYQAIVMARDSLKQREEAQKMQTEIEKLDEEVDELRRKNDEEKVSIQDLELTLIKRRRRAEKCRRLAEAQSSYRTMLEKMIRDAMHQSVVYKEQVRLNQAASNALMARLEAQKAICDNSEKELHKKFKQRDELEKQIRPDWEQGRKRSRMDDSLMEDKDHRTILYLPGIGSRPRTPMHKQLRVFLEEEQKASEEGKHGEIEEELEKRAKSLIRKEPDENYNKAIVALENEIQIEQKLQALELDEGKRDLLQMPIIREQEIGEGRRERIQFPTIRAQEIEEDEDCRRQRGKGNRVQYPTSRTQEMEEDEESRKQRGKGNVERWLQMLLDNSQYEMEPENANCNEKSSIDGIITKLNEKFPQEEEAKSSKHPEFNKQVQENDKGKRVEEIVELEANTALIAKGNPCAAAGEKIVSARSSEVKDRTQTGKEKVLARSESARTLRRIPSSPLLTGMRKGVECMIKKPMVTGDDDGYNDHAAGNSFIKSSIKSIKRAVKI